MDDILLDRIKAHRSAPDVYDPPTFDEMADRIIDLEKAYDAWADTTARYKNRCKTLEASLLRVLDRLDELEELMNEQV